MKKELFTIALCAICFFVFGQKTTCSLSQEELQKMGEQLLETRRNSPTISRNGEKYVPIRIIEINETDGSGQRPIRDYIELLCRINETFSPKGVRFYLENNQIIQINDAAFGNDQSDTSNQKIKTAQSETAINLVVVENVNPNGNLSSGINIISTPIPSKKWILLWKHSVNIIDGATEHSIGHYFNLLHTCNGWEGSPWPINSAACANSIAPNGILTEKLDGSNGDTAGDFIFDTPPDYNFSFDDTNCGDGYMGAAKDPDCQLLTGFVDEKNVMNFENICPPFSLTFGQGDAILTELEHPSFAYLQNNYFPPADLLVAPPNFMLEPTANAQTPFNNQFFFKWDSVPNATFYLLEICKTNSFSTPILYSQITSLTELNIADLTLNSNLNYFWRVTPYNSFATCTTPPPARKFISGLFAVPTSEISPDFQAGIYPNPCRTGQRIDVEISPLNYQNVDFQLIDLYGRTVFFKKNAFISNHFILESTENNFSAGVYFIKINTDNGIILRKLVIGN
jgi:hypothetical protein